MSPPIIHVVRDRLIQSGTFTCDLKITAV